MLEARFESPLAHAEAATNTYVSLREIAERGMIDLRGLGSDKKFMAAAKAVLEVDLPKQPRTAATWGDIRVFWLSPDQWLITCPRARAQELTDALTKELEGIHSLAVNVSDMRAIIRLEGEGVREVVMKGTSIDLTGGVQAALWGFFIFYVICVVITWTVYTRKGGLLHDIERGGRISPAAQPAE